MRLFVALRVDPQTAALIEKRIDKSDQNSSIRWTRAENTHLTLKFLGTVENESVAAIKERLGALASRHQPIALRFTGPGCFPPQGPPKIFWIGVQGDLVPLRALAQEVSRELAKIGFSEDQRDYVPHLTVGRWNARSQPSKSGSRPAGMTLRDQFCTLLADFESPMILTRTIDLMRSRVDSTGARYEVVASFPLGRT